jgi:hypothetical protein
MSLPVCAHIPELPNPFALPLPGGIEIERVNLMDVVQPALAPLVPVFEIVDTVVAVFKCIKAIPDALGPPPDPSKLGAAVPELAEKVDKLLRLLPQVSVPIMVVRLVDLAIETLTGARNQFAQLRLQEQRIATTVNRAAQLDDGGLLAIAECARGNLRRETANVGKQLASVGRVVGTINLLMGLIGGPAIPAMGAVDGGALEEVVDVLDETIGVLRTVRSQVPLP